MIVSFNYYAVNILHSEIHGKGGLYPAQNGKKTSESTIQQGGLVIMHI